MIIKFLKNEKKNGKNSFFLKCQKKGIKKTRKKGKITERKWNKINKNFNLKKKDKKKKIFVKATNFYYNWELMVMATNLYYHCWFVRARLQETHGF